MELVTNTACLLCKEQTTVLKLDNVKSYLDKLFDTFFDKSNIFKDEFQGMVADASLCLMCTPKVNICCNLRNDYEDKYNGKCLQKLLSSSGCLMCDGNSTPLTKTQDMPKSLIAQIELFMISTSFPESYSNSALCLTCIHSLNIWHEVRENIMKLTLNEVGENDCTNEDVDSDETDVSNFALSINSKKTKADESNKKKVGVIDIADSDAEVQNEGSSLDQAGNDESNEEIDDNGTKAKLSDSSRSESPILNSSKFDRKFKNHKRIQKLSLTTQVMDKENLISDSSDSEIDGLNKIVEEIVESYENEEASAQRKSPSSSKASNPDNERNITKIDDSSDSESQSQKSSSKSSNSSPCKSTSYKWISKRTAFSAIVNDDTSDSESTKDKNAQKIKRKRRVTPSQSDDDEPKVDGSSDEETPKKRKTQQKFQLRRTKGSPEPEGKATNIDDSSDEECTQKNTQKLKHRGLLGFVKQSSELENLKKKSDDDKQVSNIIDSSDDESISEESKPKIVLKLKTGPKKKSDDEQTDSENSSDSNAKSASPNIETTIIDDSSDNESNHEQRSQKKRKSRKLKNRKTRKSENDKHSSSDFSDSESVTVASTQKLKTIESKTKTKKLNELEATKLDNSSDSGSVSDASTSDFRDNTRSRRTRINSELKTQTNKNSNHDETMKIDDSSDSESSSAKIASNLQNKRKSLRLRNSSEPETPEKKRADDSPEIVTKKSPPKKVTIMQDSTSSDSSDEEKTKTVSSKSRKRKIAEKDKKRDNLWLYLNRTLKKLQSVKKLHKTEKINLPNKELDDKFFKQVPYVLLEKNEKTQMTKSVNKRAQKTETIQKKAKTAKTMNKKAQKSKRVVKKKFPKINLRSPKRNSTDKENNRRSSERINKPPVIITLSDDESEDVEENTFVELDTLRCNICDKISNTLWECKAHDLFHTKPEQVVINVVREDLKGLLAAYNLDKTKNINRILSKYLKISENSVSNLLVNLSNGNSSKGSVEGEETLENDSTVTSTSRIPLPTEKSSSTSEDNSDCENIPNVINEKKRKLSILLNNSREKSDSSSPNPKRVRFALDHKASIPHLQLNEDLSKSKSKLSKDDVVHNVTL